MATDGGNKEGGSGSEGGRGRSGGGGTRGATHGAPRISSIAPCARRAAHPVLVWSGRPTHPRRDEQRGTQPNHPDPTSTTTTAGRPAEVSSLARTSRGPVRPAGRELPPTPTCLTDAEKRKLPLVLFHARPHVPPRRGIDDSRAAADKLAAAIPYRGNVMQHCPIRGFASAGNSFRMYTARRQALFLTKRKKITDARSHVLFFFFCKIN